MAVYADSLGCHDWRVVSTGILELEARDAAGHPACTCGQPHDKGFSMSAMQLCPTFCDPMACSLPGSSVHGILQARILEWVAIPFSRGSSQPRDQIRVSCTVSRFFTT